MKNGLGIINDLFKSLVCNKPKLIGEHFCYGALFSTMELYSRRWSSIFGDGALFSAMELSSRRWSSILDDGILSRSHKIYLK